MQPFLFIIGAILIMLGFFQIVRIKTTIGLSLAALGVLSIIIAFATAPKEEISEKAREISIRIVGSKTIGIQLMPDMVLAFFHANGYEIIEKGENGKSLVYLAQSKEKNEILRIEIAAIGSVLGFKALIDETCEITMASDNIDSLTLELLGKHFAPLQDEHLIAYDAIQVIVHPAVGDKLSHISKEHLQALLNGKLTDWTGLHPDIKGQIKVVLRDDNSGTYHFMKEKILVGTKLRKDAIRLDYFEKIASVVERDSLAIGFVNYAIDSIHLKNVSILGVVNDTGVSIKPTSQSIQNNSYPLSRKLFLYTNRSSDHNERVQSLIRFCKSPAAAKAIREDGLVPLVEK